MSLSLSVQIRAERPLAKFHDYDTCRVLSRICYERIGKSALPVNLVLYKAIEHLSKADALNINIAKWDYLRYCEEPVPDEAALKFLDEKYEELDDILYNILAGV